MQKSKNVIFSARIVIENYTMKNAERIMALQCIETDAVVKSVAEAKEIEWENIATRVGGKVSHNPHKVEETDAISVPATLYSTSWSGTQPSDTRKELGSIPRWST